MSEFTKRPWSVYDDGVYPGVDAPGKSIIIWGNENELCGIRGNTREEAIANANLISAAPDMYDALKRIIDEKAPSYHDCIDDGLDKCAWCDAIDAIKKAEGK